MIASMWDFNGVILFPSIICPNNFFFKCEKKSDLSGAAFTFSLSSI